MLTPFFQNKTERDQIRKILESCSSYIADLEIYEHVDCFDLIPNGINKYEGIKQLTKYLGMKPEQVIAVGDGVNDYPMFQFAGQALGIHLPDSSMVTRNFPNIDSVFEYLSDYI